MVQYRTDRYTLYVEDRLPRQPMTQTLNITATRSQLSDLVNQVFRRESRVIIQKSGLPAAALVSADDLARLEAFEQRAADFAALAQTQDAFADVPLDEHEREVARAVNAARGRLRAKAARPDASSLA